MTARMAQATPTPRELLERLVGFDTTSYRTNLPIVDYVRDHLAAHGVASTLVPDATGEKAALYATIGPAVEGGVVLSAHTDVVPVEGQKWSTDPFRLTARDGRLYGRGSVDMKGFVATVLAHVPAFAAAGLRRPVHIALSYDEEVGCLGVRPLSKAMAESVPRPAAVIVGEPTGMRPVDAHKSGYRIETVVTGREAHSSAPHWGVNAIIHATRFVARIERLGERLTAIVDERFAPPSGTVSVGEIAGGTAHNIVPNSCKVVWGVRGLPETDVPALVDEVQASAERELVPEMRARAPEAGITTRIVSFILPLRTTAGSGARALIAELTGEPRMSTVSYGTDGGFFEAIGWPTVVCGPGSIEQAHKPDEFIAENALADCAGFLGRLEERLSA